MYIIQSSHRNETPTLHELDKEGLRLAKLAYPGHRFIIVSKKTAHDWIRNHNRHSTSLRVGRNGDVHDVRTP